MDQDDRIAICNVIAASCMWGHGGLASVILDGLDKRLPHDPTWHAVYNEHSKAARREAVGVITDEKVLNDRLRDGYVLCNWDDDDGYSLFRPGRYGGGLDQYVSKALSDAHRAREEAMTETLRNVLRLGHQVP